MRCVCRHLCSTLHPFTPKAQLKLKRLCKIQTEVDNRVLVYVSVCVAMCFFILSQSVICVCACISHHMLLSNIACLGVVFSFPTFLCVRAHVLHQCISFACVFVWLSACLVVAFSFVVCVFASAYVCVCACVHAANSTVMDSEKATAQQMENKSDTGTLPSPPIHQ